MDGMNQMLMDFANFQLDGTFDYQKDTHSLIKRLIFTVS